VRSNSGRLIQDEYRSIGGQHGHHSTGVTTYSYDALNRPATVTYPAGKTFTYSYDNAGNRATLTDPDGLLTTYTYGTRTIG
jgi:YD repeat-containing protein